MPSYLQRLARCSFAGIEFPYAEHTLKGSVRVGYHEARYRPGAELEKHKRKLYTVQIAPIFDERVPGYPNLYPDGLNKLVDLFEACATRELVLPTVGSFPAMATEWTRTAKPAVQMSGETVVLSFTEDSVSETLLTGVRTRIAALSVDAAAAQVTTTAASLDLTPSALDMLNNAVDAALQAKALVEMQALLVEGKIQGAIQLLREIDNTLLALQHPENWSLVNAVQELGGSLKNLSDTVTGGSLKVRSYVVPKVMTVQELSQALYKDSRHASDLISMNPRIEDSNAVPAGLSVRWVEGL